MEYVFGLRRDIWLVPSENGKAFGWEVWWIRKSSIPSPCNIPTEFRRVAGGAERTFGEAIKISIEWEVAAFKAGPKGTPMRQARPAPPEPLDRPEGE